MIRAVTGCRQTLGKMLLRAFSRLSELFPQVLKKVQGKVLPHILRSLRLPFLLYHGYLQIHLRSYSSS